MTKQGIYKHFKGKLYRVIGLAKHSETKEEFVVYVNLDNENEIWIRPEKMFNENIISEGKSFPRFELIKEN